MGRGWVTLVLASSLWRIFLRQMESSVAGPHSFLGGVWDRVLSILQTRKREVGRGGGWSRARTLLALEPGLLGECSFLHTGCLALSLPLCHTQTLCIRQRAGLAGLRRPCACVMVRVLAGVKEAGLNGCPGIAHWAWASLTCMGEEGRGEMRRDLGGRGVQAQGRGHVLGGP